MPLLAIALIKAHTLYAALTEPELPWPPTENSIQFPEHHRIALRAVKKFNALPAARRGMLMEQLEQALDTVPSWLAELNRHSFAILCMGEYHDTYLRRFLAERVFPSLQVDVLALEATHEEAVQIRSKLESGEELMLLDAEVSRLLRSALTANPGLQIWGIEESQAQFNARKSLPVGSREATIEKNLRAKYLPNRRHVVLYGAFHCSRQSQWLFQRLRRHPPAPAKAEELLNVRVTWEHLEGPFEGFSYFLEAIGFPASDYVIPRTDRIPKEVSSWFPFFSANELDVYSTIIVFKAKSTDSS